VKCVVNVLISDTWSEHIPKRGKYGLGTDAAFVCSSIKQAVVMANKLAFLVAGETQDIFTIRGTQREVRSGCRRKAWSNDNRTHHIELLFDGKWTEFNNRTRKEGISG